MADPVEKHLSDLERAIVMAMDAQATDQPVSRADALGAGAEVETPSRRSSTSISLL